VTPAAVESLLTRVGAGERLPAGDVHALAQSPDILSLGMLADAVRRRLHGGTVTFVRVTLRDVRAVDDAVPDAAREIRLIGAPDSLAAAVGAVSRARMLAGNRPVTGLSPGDLHGLASRSGTTLRAALDELRAAGLDAVGAVPLEDAVDGLDGVLDDVVSAGFRELRLGVRQAGASERASLFLRAAELQDRLGCIRALDPLPSAAGSLRPTTGYDDVRTVAVARLAAPNIPTIQVDWQRYGPKLAQVALTFGADDLDAVTAADDAPDGRRRAPLEEVRRNIEAAGFAATERDGRFLVVA
jgi:2-iminoacetate synthase ThiH